VSVRLNQESSADGVWALISVTDRGPGIPQEVRRRLFERFATGPGSQGLGLGLYLARRVADAHGGTLTVQSAAGMGATFTFALPIDGVTS
jgi:two-component system OmpR family sensor kinase